MKNEIKNIVTECEDFLRMVNDYTYTKEDMLVWLDSLKHETIKAMNNIEDMEDEQDA